MPQYSKYLLPLGVILVAIAVGGGLAQLTARPVADYPSKPTVAGASTNMPAPSDQSTSSLSVNTAPAPESNVTVEAPPPAPVIPPFTGLQVSTETSAAIQEVLKSFYQAYNAGDQETLVRLFDLAVPVTTAVDGALAEGRPRPVSATITQSELRSDSSAVVQVKEERSNGAAVERSFELIPTQNSYLLVAYRSAADSGETSGFDQ